jgi:transcriptional regulator with XRE-family HTH domain
LGVQVQADLPAVVSDGRSLLGQRLVQLRGELGLTQRAFATGAGVSLTQYVAWERDGATPHVLSLEKLARYAATLNGKPVDDIRAWLIEALPL